MRSLCLLVAALLAVVAAAQVTPPSVAPSVAAPAQPGTRGRHEFTYRVDDATDATVLEATLPVTITVNHTGATQRLIQHFRVEPVGDTKRYFARAECSPGSFTANQGSTLVTCVLHRNEETSWWVRVLARTKSYPLRATPEFLGGLQSGESVTSPFIGVRVQAGLLPVCFGGFVGALLFAIFRLSTLYLSRPGAEECSSEWGPAIKSLPASALCVVQQLIGALVFAGRGFIVALIFIFLTQALGTGDLALSIRVEDFYGGVIVGLLSLSIGKWIAGKLDGAAGDTREPPLPGSQVSLNRKVSNGPDNDVSGQSPKATSTMPPPAASTLAETPTPTPTPAPTPISL